MTLKPFYDLSEERRTLITEQAMSVGRTILERWAYLTEAEASPWSARAEKAAELLLDAKCVADLGCGTMILERHLRVGQRYIPVDVVYRDNRTLVCDFNVDPPPDTGADSAACLGLIEYIYDPAAFLRALRGQYDVLVLSYCTTDAPSAPSNRRQHAWVNDFSQEAVARLLSDTGWAVTEGLRIDDLQTAWRTTPA